MKLPVFDLPKATRIWDLDVPIIIDHEKKQADTYITSTIEEPYVYNELCYTLKELPEDYTANIHINCPGGIIDSAFMVAEAITKAKAKTVAHLSGTVASAGTILSLSCDELSLTPHLSFMIHNYSGGLAGKGHEMKARQKFTDTHLNTAFTHFYKGFLTEEEMERVIEGTDLWMDTKEVSERWEKRIAYLGDNQ